MRIQVVEVFDSMQGEGYWMGIYCTFIRLPGCNFACPFCDTVFSRASVELDTDTYKFQHHVVITGGEPSIHPHIQELIEELHSKGYFVHVETNGSNIPALKTADWITCSPKPIAYAKSPLPSRWIDFISLIKEIKEVVTEDWHEDFWVDFATLNKLIIWLQPCDGTHETFVQSCNRIKELIAEHPDVFRAGIQLHKFYGAQ